MLRKTVYLLLILVLILTTGCQTDVPPITLTQAPTESKTEPPTEPPVVRNAETLYTNMQVAVGMKFARSYVIVQECKVASEDAAYEVVNTSDVCWHEDPFRAYTRQEVLVDLNAPGVDMSMTDVSEICVQVEDRIPVGYIHDETHDAWYRYEEDCLPSEVKDQYAYWILPGMRPTQMTMDPGTGNLKGREVYVLRCDMSYEEVFRTSADGVGVELVYHVDAETFLPLQMEITYSGVEDYLMETIEEAMGMELGDASMFQCLEMQEIISNISFEEVQVPTVPEEGIANSRPMDEDGNVAQTL